MHLLIVSCTPRAKEKSNTDKILDELKLKSYLKTSGGKGSSYCSTYKK